jgi:NADPH:quinone reductase-like Zn-dependent oxidoreductase
MAEQAVVDPRRAIELPNDVDVAKVAAAMNPAMSSWVALRRRVPTAAGHGILVLGATGNAGTMAVQVAKRLGAARVVAAGRNRDRLNALTVNGADEIVQLTDDPEATEQSLASAAADIDIVIDYLWSSPAVHAMTALLKARADRSRALDWIQIGAITGPALELPSVLLRSANLRIQGVGQGAISTAAYREELPHLAAEINADVITIDTHTAPLENVERVWTAPETPGQRMVLIP